MNELKEKNNNASIIIAVSISIGILLICSAVAYFFFVKASNENKEGDEAVINMNNANISSQDSDNPFSLRIKCLTDSLSQYFQERKESCSAMGSSDSSCTLSSETETMLRLRSDDRDLVCKERYPLLFNSNTSSNINSQ